jgi:TonB family protein
MKRAITAAALLASTVSASACFGAAPNAPADPSAALDWGPYMAGLQREIKKHWTPPKRTISKRTIVDFKVSRAGKISDARLYQSSGDPGEDAAALKAITETGLVPLPKDSPRDIVDVRFTFDYNVYSISVSLRSADPKRPIPSAFARELQKEIESNVRWSGKKKVSAAFDLTISPSGALTAIHAFRPSENASFDAMALSGIKKSFPLRKTAIPSAVRLICTVERTTPPKYPEEKSQNTKTANALNNEGVKLLKEDQYEKAIKIFLYALDQDPQNTYARENLAIAYNNLALKRPKDALPLFYRAMYVQKGNASTRQNLLEALKLAGKRAASPADHILLARKCLAAKDFIGASVHCDISASMMGSAYARKLRDQIRPDADKQFSSKLIP